MKKTLVLTREEIEKEELDWEEDLKDFVCKKLKVNDYKEIESDWSFDDKYFVIKVKI